MDLAAALENLLSPPILFFFVGLVAVRPALRRVGGICLVSNALRVRH